MRSNPESFILVLTLFLVISHCSSTNQLSNSSPEDQFNSSLKKMQKGRNNEKAKQLLNSSLLRFTDLELTKLDTLSSQDPFEKKEAEFDIRNGLNKKYGAALAYLDSPSKEKHKTLHSKFTTFKNEFQSELFETGQRKLNEALVENDKTKSKRAYQLLKKSSNAGLTNEKLDSLIDQSLNFSRLHYNVTISAANAKYRTLIKDEFRKISSTNQSLKKITFESEKLNSIDCNIEINFAPLSIVDDFKRQSQNFRKQVTTGYRTVRNGDSTREEPVIETVSGTVIQSTTIKIARWDVQINANSNSNHCDLVNKIFNEQIDLKSTEIKTQGDRRAIPNEYFSYVSEQFLSEREIAEVLIERIYNQIEFSYFK